MGIRVLLLSIFGVALVWSTPIHAESLKKRFKKFGSSVIDTVKETIGFKKKQVKELALATETNSISDKDSKAKSAYEALLLHRKTVEGLLAKYESFLWPGLIKAIMMEQSNTMFISVGMEELVIDIMSAYARDHFYGSSTSLLDLFYAVRVEKNAARRIVQKVRLLITQMTVLFESVDKVLVLSIKEAIPLWEQMCVCAEQDIVLLQRFEETLQELLNTIIHDQSRV